MSHYPIYLIESLGTPRNHQAIFIETQQDGSGTKFHVTGNIQAGMTYETKQTPRPNLDGTFVSKMQLRWIKIEDLPRVDTICRTNPPLTKQFDGFRRINKDQPLRRCQEWTRETIGELKVVGILLDSCDPNDVFEARGRKGGGVDGK